VKIVHLCVTPVAGAAWAAAEAFGQLGHESFAFTGRRYSNGREMPAHGGWPPGDQDRAQILEADVIVCHQGHPYRLPWYPKGKPTVFVYHSQPYHVWRDGEKDGWPWAVVGQYQTRLYENCWMVPNLIPLNHPWYQAGEKPTDRVMVAYSPSNRTLTGWDDKGYLQTMAAFHGLQAEVDLIMGVSLEQCLARKATAHIVIDECVTGSYHRSSLEGLALGCVVVNNCDALCANNIRQMTGGAEHPFVTCDAGNLRNTLDRLIAKGPKQLIQAGLANRKWVDAVWNAKDLIERNWVPLIHAAVEHAGH